MIEISKFPAARGSIAVLLHPSVVPVIDVFRSLGSLEDQYDLSLLDGLEQALAAYIPQDSAKAIVSDALLLAFAMTRQRGRPFCHRPLGARQGSTDEYCLMTLLGSLRSPVLGVALESAAVLGITSLNFMLPLVGELVRQIELGSLVFNIPDLPEFRAIVDGETDAEQPVDEFLSRSGLHFKF